MSDGPSSAPSAQGSASLYRRFRPGRFAEMRGQDHVVRALQGAVANQRVAHAYLFSGPRGTGKTTAARVLAKALNCELPSDGDACGTCASCVAITAGASLDVTELDAASNNGVDDIREITAGAWHTTPGRWKVYIFDEVHQLSKAASAALLKTLEEPPGHVVFVLATTDPHKVLPTIRSRTQHLEFRLFNGDTLADLLRDADETFALAADAATIDAAVHLARGSARDALSALDQLLATGSTESARPTFDPVLAGLVDEDAVATLAALAALHAAGWEPEQLAEEFARELRQVFLLQVAPGVAEVVDADRERLRAWGEALGLARTVRALELLGRSMREMRSAPEKIVMLELALVRLVRPELDASYESLDERLTRLERGAPRAAATPAPAPSAPREPRRPIGATPERPSAPVAAKSADETPTPTAEAAPAVDERGVGSPASPTSGTSDLADVQRRFAERVVPRTSRGAQLILRSAAVIAVDGTALTIAVASEQLRESAETITPSVRAALEHEFHATMQVRWVVDGTVSAAPASKPAARARAAAPEDVHDDTLGADDDAEVIVVESAVEHLITEIFPGAEEIS